MKQFKTEHFSIGGGAPPYLIAEIGLNHNGDLALAKRASLAAKEAGANGVKFQLFTSDLFIAPEAKLDDGTPLREFFRRFELTEGEWRELADTVHSLGLDFICSVFDLSSLELYRTLGASTIKIASGDCVNRLLVEAAAKTGLSVILSTGAADEREVATAKEWIGENVILLQCVSSYPADPADLNLRVIPSWIERYGTAVGLSDHCTDNAVAFAAIALGASVIEKHFTLDRSLEGPDHAMSLDPAAFRSLVDGCHAVHRSLGDGRKRCTESELAVRGGARRSFYTAGPIRAGERFTAQSLLPLRPGSEGEHPEVWIGKEALRDYAPFERLDGGGR